MAPSSLKTPFTLQLPNSLLPFSSYFFWFFSYFPPHICTSLLLPDLHQVFAHLQFFTSHNGTFLLPCLIVHSGPEHLGRVVLFCSGHGGNLHEEISPISLICCNQMLQELLWHSLKNARCISKVHCF